MADDEAAHPLLLSSGGALYHYLDARMCTWSFSTTQGMMSFVSFSTPVSEFSQATLVACSGY